MALSASAYRRMALDLSPWWNTGGTSLIWFPLSLVNPHDKPGAKKASSLTRWKLWCASPNVVLATPMNFSLGWLINHYHHSMSYVVYVQYFWNLNLHKNCPEENFNYPSDKQKTETAPTQPHNSLALGYWTGLSLHTGLVRFSLVLV